MDASKADAGKTDASKANAGTIDKAEASKAEAATPSCEENTWSYLDGTCGSGKVRKMRIARTAPAVNRISPAPLSAAPEMAIEPSVSRFSSVSPGAASVVPFHCTDIREMAKRQKSRRLPVEDD